VLLPLPSFPIFHSSNVSLHSFLLYSKLDLNSFQFSPHHHLYRDPLAVHGRGVKEGGAVVTLLMLDAERERKRERERERESQQGEQSQLR